MSRKIIGKIKSCYISIKAPGIYDVEYVVVFFLIFFCISFGKLTLAYTG